MVGLILGRVTASLNAPNQVVLDLLQQLQALLQKHFELIFITHIRAHSCLPGLMAQRNETTDHLAMLIFKSPAEEQAVKHTNVYCLHVSYYISWRQARQVVDTCTISMHLNK